MIRKLNNWFGEVGITLRHHVISRLGTRRMSHVKLSNTDLLKTISFALIHSHIAHGIIIYGDTTKTFFFKEKIYLHSFV